jgi:hypothetical protein
MIEHFDTALTKFEADVRSGKAAVKVVHKNNGEQSGGAGSTGRGGGGALSWPFILVLLALVTFRRSVRLERMTE